MRAGLAYGEVVARLGDVLGPTMYLAGPSFNGQTAATPAAVQEHLDGKAVEWLEQVSEEQYQG